LELEFFFGFKFRHVYPQKDLVNMHHS
jgi:hypothetical protein